MISKMAFTVFLLCSDLRMDEKSKKSNEKSEKSNENSKL